MAAVNHKDHTSAWEAWEALSRRRDTDPVNVMTEYLRAHGWIVERPDTISLPVHVVSSGGFTHEDGYRLTLHVRVQIGDRKAQVDSSVDLQHADMAIRGLIGPTASKFQRGIMQELEPQIALGFEQEIARAKQKARAHD